MHFLIDENVPSSAVAVLQEIGQSVRRVVDILPAGTDDEALAALAQKEDWILVTHDKDFKKLSNRFKKLNRVELACAEPMDAIRLKEAASLLHSEWEYREKSLSENPSARMIVKITTTTIVTIR